MLLWFLLGCLPLFSIVSAALLITRREHLAYYPASCGLMSSSSSTATKLIRWGIVGVGDVTEKKSGPPFWKNKQSQLKAVYARTPHKAQEWAERVPGGTCLGFDCLDDFLRVELDAIYIATPPGAHLQVVEDIVERKPSSLRAIYVEKPVGRCAAETKRIQSLCDKHQIRFYTAYISRAYPRTQKLAALLQSGSFGKVVQSVNYKLVGTNMVRGLESSDVPWRLDASKAGGGLVMDVGCHVLDRIDYLLGPLVQVSGSAERRNKEARYRVEDYVELHASIGTSDWAVLPSEGAKVSCTWDFSGTTDTDAEDRLELKTDSHVLRMVGMSPNAPILVCDLNDGTVLEAYEFESPEHTGSFLTQAVTNELVNHEASSSETYVSRGDNAIRTSQVLDTVLQTYYASREIGYWNDPSRWKQS